MSSAVKNSGMAILAHRYKIFGKALERVQHDNQVVKISVFPQSIFSGL